MMVKFFVEVFPLVSDGAVSAIRWINVAIAGRNSDILRVHRKDFSSLIGKTEDLWRKRFSDAG